MQQFLIGLLDFIFLPRCAGCKTKLVQGEVCICTICWSTFPEANYHSLLDNPVMDRFIRNQAIVHGFSLYRLRKQSNLGQVIFAMKYRNQPTLAELLGIKCGHTLRETILDNNPQIENKVFESFSTIQGIIPIPLHIRRLQERGYNQSDFFAKGLSKALQLPIYRDCVTRIKNTPSQTQKNKSDRMINLKEAFIVDKPDLIANKHLLLVDDIITTGATLTACAEALIQGGIHQISIATITVVDY